MFVCDSGYKKTVSLLLSQVTQGRQKRGSTLIYYFIIFKKLTKSATLISQSPDSHYHRLAQDLLIRYSFLPSIISKRNEKVKLFYHHSCVFLGIKSQRSLQFFRILKIALFNNIPKTKNTDRNDTKQTVTTRRADKKTR